VSGIQNEYRIISQGAGWADRSGRGHLRLEGTHVGSFLQALVSNDVSHIETGEGVYATYLTPNGRMLTDLEICRRPAFWLLGLETDRAAPIAERLDQSIFSEDVRVADVTSELAETVVVGGDAAARLGAALSIPVERLQTLRELGQTEWQDGFVVRLGESRLPMYTIVVPIAGRGEVVDRLEASAVRQVSPQLLDALRIEVGRPRFGVDMTEETIPLEAGLLDRAISTTKGCYVGQEIVIRVLHRGGGRVAKRLVTLSLAAPPDGPPPPGTPLLDADKRIGQLTSVSWSPTSSDLIALGYVQRDVAEEGRRVTVGATGAQATVSGFAR
jgi:folate-binding protein YgfZ